jgi:hypothetical protein
MAKPKKAKNEVAVMESGVAREVTVGGRKFTVAKLVTVPQLKQAEGQTVAFEVTSRMYIAKAFKVKPGAKKGDEERKPPTMVNVRELTTGRPMQYIVPAKLATQWADNYDGDPDNEKAAHGYVGRKFAVYYGAMGKTASGRQLRDIECVEIEDHGELADAPAKA